MKLYKQYIAHALLIATFLFLANSSFTQLKIEMPNLIENQVIIRMQKGESPNFLSQSLPDSYELKIKKTLSEYSDIWLLEFNNNNTTVYQVMNELNSMKSVLFAQPNREVKLRATPNDPYFGNQWQHQKIDSQLAWDITTGGSTPSGTEIVVALIESADIINHNDLKDNRWINTAEIPNNGIDDDGNGYIDDYNGWNVSTNSDAIGVGSHGTSCAGMIGAKGNNGIGVSGINWDVKIMDIAGYDSPFTESNIIECYNYALQSRLLWNQTNGVRGAFVVATSASWGIDGASPNDYPIWCGFYNDLGQVGILNAGATTNSNYNVDQVGDVPSACASNYMVSVTATNQSDIIDFAGYGQTTIDVAVPGSSIYTTAPNNGYTSTSGTSFATPLTAGLIGLMYSVPCLNLELMAKSNPQGTADIVRQALFDGVDQTSYLMQRTTTGGRINAKNAIDLLMDEVCSSCIIPSNVVITDINDDNTTIEFDANNVDNYVISLQVAGTGNWLNDTTSSSQYTFTGLMNCTTYEFYITTDCGNGEFSIPTSIYSFTTSGCGNCIDLNYCETKATNPESAFNVLSPSNIEGNYNFTPTSLFGGNVNNGYVFGNLVLVDDGTANANEGCSPLINSSAISGNIAVVKRGSCSFVDKVMNAQNTGATAVIVINNVATSPIEMGGTNNNITIPAVMISQTDGNTLLASINNNENPTALLGQQNEWIESFKINGNITTTGDNEGYNLSSSPITLNIGQNYSFTLTTGFSGPPLKEYTRIWIDLNQDGVFDNSEIVYDQGTSNIGVLIGSFTIPNNSVIGSTRMRVQMNYNGSTTQNLPDVCGNFIAGEVEDYCVFIDSKSGLSNKKTPTINIFPNPAAEKVTITTQNKEAENLVVYNTKGQVIKKVFLHSHSIEIDVKGWTAGIYFFHTFKTNGELMSIYKVGVIR